MRIIVLLAGACLVSGPAWGQSAGPAFEIHGVVTEIGLNSGLPGAEVTLFEFAGPDRDRQVYSTAVTDPRGEFAFHPAHLGEYWIEVKKQAYFATMSIDGVASLKPPTESTGTLASVSAAHPTQEVRLALMRPGELAGSVVDENDKPIPKVLVEITMAGSPALARATARTDTDGSFTARMLMPGEYLVKISPPLSGLITALPKFSEEDLKVVDEELETVYWPGAPDERSASPMRVNPGASASLGTIRLRKTPSYRARVSMEGCKPEDLPSLSVSTPTERVLFVRTGDAALPAFPAKLASCQEILFRGLKPGSYTFQLNSSRAWAAAPVEVGKKNFEIRLTLAPGVEISGRIISNRIAAEGDTPPVLGPQWGKVLILLLPADQQNPAARASTASPDAKGAFVLGDVRGLSHKVRIEGLSEKYYVKEIRLDGRPAPGGVVTLYQGSQLEIVVDDQPGVIFGSVTAGSLTDGDKPFSQPLVFVAKWPTLEIPRRPVTGDNQGQFQVAGLEPGEYRVLAVQSAALPDGSQISEGMLSTLWNSAQKVTVERGGSQSIALKLSDPLR